MSEAESAKSGGEVTPSEGETPREVYEAARYYFERKKVRTERCPTCRQSLYLTQRIGEKCPLCKAVWSRDDLVRLTQEDVANLLETPTWQPSRSEVQRLLAAAEERGIAKTVVVPPVAGHFLGKIEQDLREKFGLGEVRVIPGREELFDASEDTKVSEEHARNLRTAVLERAAGPAAEIVIGILQHAEKVLAAERSKHRTPDPAEEKTKHPTLCLSWGFSVSRVVQELRPGRSMSNVVVAPFVGALTAHPFEPIHDSNLLVQKAAQILLSEQNAYWLLSPAIVRGAEMRDSIDRSDLVKEALDKARGAHVVVISVAHPDVKRSTLAKAKLLEPHEIQEKVTAGAIGEIGGLFFNEDGEAVPGIQPIGLNLEDLKKIVGDKRVVLAVVAGDPHRVSALACAIRAGLINALVTDHLTAQALLDEH